MLLNVACTSSNRTASDPTAGSPPAVAQLAPDSGRWENGETVSHWRSVVDGGQVIAVEEQYKQFSRIGERRYTYNDTGALEHVEEQRGDSLVPWANIPPFDAPEATTVPLRVSRVVFAAGVPICAARHYAGTHRR